MLASRSMRSRVLMVMAAVIVAAVCTAAKGNPFQTGPSEVTSTVFDTDAFGNTTQLQGDDQLTQSAVYVAGNTNIISQIDATGSVDWNLDLGNSNRGFYLTLMTTAGAPVPGLPIGANFYSGRVISRCFAPGGGTTGYSWFSITTDDPNCAMRVNFTSGSTAYFLVMSPAYAGTGRALVHCNAVSGSSCVDWTITTNANTPNAGVANLYTVGKGGKEILVAACKLTFRMHVTLP